MTIARVTPLLRLPRNLHEFDYTVSEELRETCLPGTFVAIPFRGKTVAGLVWETGSDSVLKIKPISRVLPLHYRSWDVQREHFEWFTHNYCVSRATALKTLLPDIPKTFLSKGTVRQVSIKTSKLHGLVKMPSYDGYLDQIQKTVKKKKSALIFFPTIHDCELFEPFARDALGDESVTVLHSDCAPTMLFSRWISLFDAIPRCIIATRTGTSVPLSHLGAVIIDAAERTEHNQYDMNPRFDIRAVVHDMHARTQCHLMYSSVAPRLEEMGSGSVLRCKSVPDPISVAPIIVNMRDELRARGRGYISEILIDTVRESLINKHGVFLFLNRTGESRMIACRDCAYMFSCAQCGSPTRAAQSRLLCDHCDTDETMSSHCPQCRSVRFHFIALGTERIVELIKKEFPNTNVRECTQQNHPLELLECLHTDGRQTCLENTIIVGTTYLPRQCSEAFWNIGCIGMLSGDPALSLSDFRVEERHVQILFELKHLASLGNAAFVVQTFSPESRHIAALRTGNYGAYAVPALAERKTYTWPPYTRLIRLRINTSSRPKPRRSMAKAGEVE
ncbi:MAG: hypothetical protein AAB855_03990, partial [Patescibacteria group bacterium]